MGWKEWFEQAWAEREEQVYRTFFGHDTGGIYPLDTDVFASFQRGSVDPRWLFEGVLKFPPTATRASWLFATSVLSNAWEDETPNTEGWSGLGCELILEADGDFDWATALLRRLLAFQILLGCGRYGDRGPLSIGDRIPLGSPIDGRQSPLTWCMVAPPIGYPTDFHLQSGKVELLHLVGIAETEARFARENGQAQLLRLLTPLGYPVTAATRSAVV
jgi:hypothetical protein